MNTFADLGLGPKVLKAVEEAGYTIPTPIQLGAIPPALEGRDVLGIAQTGTGKTAGFVLPMITRLARGRARARMPRSLVLAPTRELAAQVAENFDSYSKYVKLDKALLIGGVSFKEQDALIDRGVDVLIATPGRLLDHFERGKLLLTGIEIMVVDEADRMLDMGFIPDLERIFEITASSAKRQTLFFSATMAPEIERITRKFLNDPAKVEVARAATTGENIAQRVVMFRASRKDRGSAEKRALLKALIEAEGEALTNAIIFCNRKTEVDAVAKDLKKSGLNAEPIHGDLDQSVRTRTLDGFRAGEIKLLCASDVAARGLDIPAVSHIFNYDVPSHAEDYVHRIGRTGRAGRSGVAITICSALDEKNLADVEKLVKAEIPRAPNPLGDEAPAEAAPEDGQQPAAEAAPARGRVARTRRGAKRESPAPVPAEVAVEAEAPAPQIEPTQAAELAAPEASPAASEPQHAAPETRRGEPREERRRGRGGRQQRDPVHERSPERSTERAEANGVVGMGDHLPSFIELSFEERMAG